jgi:hypothetical protein
MPQTNTAQMKKSSTKKHPRLHLAMCPAWIWAAITHNPHHFERAFKRTEPAAA